MNVDLNSLIVSELLWAQLWQVTLLGLVIWGAVRWLAADRPHLAHALWLVVLIKCLTPPVLASPTSPFSWLQSKSKPQRATVSGSALSGRDLDDSLRHANSSSVVLRTNLFRENKPGKTEFKSAQKNEVITGPTDSRSRPRQSGSFSWPIAFATIWLGGAVINLIVTSIRFSLFWKSTGPSQSVPQPDLEQFVSNWSRELGLKQSVRIRVVDSPIGPAVVGLFRPSILLPLVLVEGRSEKDLKPLLAHELIHIRRGDLFWAMIQTLAGCLFWFHPLVRWGVRMVTQESERSCDEETVANLGCSPATYARCLLDVLELKQSLRVAPAVPGIRPVDITSNRMERIMKLGQGCQKRTPLWVWLVMLVSGSVVLPGAALVFGQEKDDTHVGRLLPILETEKVASTENNHEPMRVASYDVADLLKRADEFGDQNLKPSVKLLWAIADGDQKSKCNLKATVKHIDSDGSVQEIVLGDSEPNLKVVGSRLYVFGTEKDHQCVKDRLNHICGMGFRQVVVEVFAITFDEGALQDLGIEWRQTDGKGSENSVHAFETVGAITTMPEVKFDPSTLVDPNFKQAAHEISLEASNEPARLSIDFKADNFPGVDQIDSFPNVEQVCSLPTELNGKLKQGNALQRSHEMQYAIASNDEVQRLLFNRVKSNSSASMHQMPTITMFSGQKASIFDGGQRPFVVGLQNLSPGINQPKIGLVSEGMTTTTSAELQSNGAIRLAYKLVFSKIEGDRQFSFLDEPWTTDKATTKDPIIEGPSVQVPIVSFAGFSSELEIPQNQSLILNTSLPDARNNYQRPNLFVIKCTAIEPETLKTNRAAPPKSLSFQQLQRIADELPVYQLQQVKPSLSTGPKAADTTASATQPSKVEDVRRTYFLKDDIQFRNRNLTTHSSMANPAEHRTSSNPNIDRVLLNSGKTLGELDNPNGVDIVENKPSTQPEAPIKKICSELPEPKSHQHEMLAKMPYINRLFRENRNEVSSAPSLPKEAVLIPLIIRSKDGSKNLDFSESTIVRGKDFRVELRLKTQVERVETEDGILFRGQQLIFELEDHALSCEQGELNLKNDGSYLFSGQDVSIEKAELRADSIVIRKNSMEQSIMELSGNSELTIDQRRLKADKIKIFFDDGSVYLEGAGSITKPEKSGPTITGNKLLFNRLRETELIIEK